MEKIDILSNVPVEVSQKCLLYMNCNSTLKLRYVSKAWKQILNECIWKQICKINQISDVNYPNETKISKNFMSNPLIPFYYERLWIYRTYLLQNWLTKPILQVQKPGLPDEVYFCDESLIVTKDSEKFKIYNADVELIDVFLEKLSGYYFIGARKHNILVIYLELRYIVVRDVKKRIFLWKRDFTDVIINDEGLRWRMAIHDDVIAVPIKHNRIISVIEISSGNIKYSIILDHTIQSIIFYNNDFLNIAQKGRLSIHNVKNGSLKTFHQLDKRSLTSRLFLETKLEESHLFIRNKTKNIMCVYDINEKRIIDTFPARYYVTVRNSKLVYGKSFKCITIRDYTKNTDDVLTIDTENSIRSVVVNKYFIIVATNYNITIYDLFTCKMKRFIGMQELFGIPAGYNILALHATDTKLIVNVSYGRRIEKFKFCILDFDIIM